MPRPSPDDPRYSRSARQSGGRPSQRRAANPAPRRAARPRARQRRRFSFWQYFFLSMVGCTTIMAAICVGIFISYVNSLPPLEELEADPLECSRVFDRAGAMTIGDFRAVKNRQAVSIKEIPPRLRNAVIAIEDERFYDHFGIDLFGILRAVKTIATSSKMQGASTITQQLARNMLKSVGKDKTLDRKIREAVAAVQIEHRYSKDQILEFYLNCFDFNYNAVGVKAAAATYFSKNLNELTVAECAAMAAMLNSPSLYNPIRHPSRTVQRRNLVLENMLRLKMIDKKAYEQARNEPLRVNFGSQAASKYPWFIDALRIDLKSRYGVGDKLLKEGGLQITSTIDPAIQEACEQAMRDGLVKVERKWQGAKEARAARDYDPKNKGSFKAGQTRLMRITRVTEDSIKVAEGGYRATLKLPDVIPYFEPDKILKPDQLIDVKIKSMGNSGELEAELGDTNPVQGAMVALDAQTGDVLGLVGGTVGSFNRAVSGGRQPGSCFKPLLYAVAMNKPWGPNSVIIDEPVQYPVPGGWYRPKNYAGEGFAGPLTLIQSLQESRNITTLRLFEALRVRSAVEQLQRFDYTQNGDRWDIPPHISVVLGTINVAPLQLAAAYQVFANLGIGSRPQFFRSITDRSGRVRVPRKDAEARLMEPIAAAQMQYMMRQVVIQRSGTGYGEVGSKFPTPTYPVICGKTGTTQDNIDAWFSGYTPELVLVCDVGFDDRKSMGPKMTGGRVAGPIWGDAFRRIMSIPGRKWKKTYDPPSGDVEYCDICAKTGKRAGPECAGSDHTVYPAVPFTRGQAPAEVCDGSGGTVAPLIAPVGSEYGWEASVALTHGIAQPASGAEGGAEEDE